MNSTSERQEKPGRLRRTLTWAFPLGLYFVLSLIYLRPIWKTFGDFVPASADDPLFNLYVLKWAAHQISLGLPDFWNANFFYPTPGATTFSDHLLGPGAQLFLFLKLIPNAIAGYNFLFFTAYFLTGFTTFWVLRRAGLGWAAAIFAGWAFAFAPYRLSQSSHLQLLIAQWIPLTLWFWDRLWADRSWKNAALFLVFYLLNLSGGCYLAYMIHIPMVVLALNRLAANRREGEGWRDLLKPRSLRVLLPVGVIAGVAAAALFLPYIRVSQAQKLHRHDGEIWAFGSTLASYFTPEPSAYWFQPPVEAFLRRVTGEGWALFFRAENSMFAGLLPTALFLVGFIAWWRRYRASDRAPDAPPLAVWKRAALVLLLLVALAGYIRGMLQVLAREVPGSHPHLQLAKWNRAAMMILLSLLLWQVLRRLWKVGRVLRWSDMDPWERGLAFSGLACFALTHPVLYLPLMKIVPGLSGMRVPARFYFFASLTLVWFAGRGFSACVERMRTARGKRMVAALLFVGLAAELTMRPLNWAPIPREESFAPVYTWIGQQSDVRAVLELPVFRDSREAWPMYFSTRNWKPVANGFSGYEAETHGMLANIVGALPDDRAFDLLQRYDISHLLLRSRSQRRTKLQHRWEAEYGPRGRGWVERVYFDPPVAVFRIVPQGVRPPEPEPAQAPASAPTSSTPKRSGR